MVIFSVTFFNFVSEKFVQSHHKLFFKYDDARNMVEEHIKEEAKYFSDADFKYQEKNYENNNLIYDVVFEHVSIRGNIVKNKIEIRRDYVY